MKPAKLAQYAFWKNERSSKNEEKFTFPFGFIRIFHFFCDSFVYSQASSSIENLSRQGWINTVNKIVEYPL